MKPGEHGIARIISATRYSWQGIKAAWKNEAAFRQEATLALIGFPLALLRLPFSPPAPAITYAG